MLIKMVSAGGLAFAQFFFCSLAMRLAIQLVTPPVERALMRLDPGYRREQTRTLLVVLGATLILSVFYFVPPVYLLVWLIGTDAPRFAQGYTIGATVGLAVYLVSKKVFKGNIFIDYI